jgi:protein-tyrosine phosphatase
MLSFFNKKEEENLFEQLKVDIHSHLLPKLDDGVKTFEESLIILEKMKKYGYSKVVTTPHVMMGNFPNTSDQILEALQAVKARIKINKLEIELEAAAEYHIDESFIKKIDDGEKLLTFGDGYILIETSFYNEPIYLRDVVFRLKALDMKPILAHPERYVYFQNNLKLLKDIADMNLLFQINMNSLVGVYDKAAQKLAEWMIDHNLVKFFGTDCHNLKHIEHFDALSQNKYFKKAIKSGLLNNTL